MHLRNPSKGSLDIFGCRIVRLYFSKDVDRLNVKAINSVLFCLEFTRLSP